MVLPESNVVAAMPDVNIVPILKAVEEIVVTAKTTGIVPRANEAARLVHGRFPDCGLAPGEIATLYLEELVVQGVRSPEILPGKGRRA